LAFEEPSEILEARSCAEVAPLLEGVGERAAAGRWAVGYVAYEAAPAFDAALRVRPGPAPPLARFTIHERALPAALPPPAVHPLRRSPWHPEMDREGYLARVGRIREAIGRGDTYQANLTYRLRGEAPGDPWELFRELYAAQPVPYAAYLDFGRWAVGSLSPELFFAREGEQLVCRPMKGTAPRGRTAVEDRAIARRLVGSEKERAENLMIVDMVRNDLGRVARPGSVRVERLFEAERYATVWQLTSTVRAASTAPLGELFAALFPSASVTGAPKVSTMVLLSELETSVRGVYTGAVGLAAPDGRCRFNVAIRTLVVDRETKKGEYGVGGGIVWDSDPEAEHRESRIKASILSERPPEFSLLETLLWEPGTGYFLVDRHLDRLDASASYFDVPCEPAKIREGLEREASSFGARPMRVRLLLSRSGEPTFSSEPRVDRDRPWRIALASRPIDPTDRFLFHKTTRRAAYDALRALAPEADDVLLWNPAGELTESTRANVALLRDGRWVTPPVECGLLAGTFRAELLERGELDEQRILAGELEPGARVRLLNSVRRWIEVEWLEGSSSQRPNQ
jgi:para-aminobenzoate synthetase/4-amino-4-deoxychorismate lyase